MSTDKSITPHHGFHADPESGVCYRTLDFMGFPGYRVGDDGSVGSLWRPAGRAVGWKIGDQWRTTKLIIGDAGRPQVSLTRNKKLTYRRVCVLVATAFIGPCPNGMVCCHRDDNPANNNLDNLRWGTIRDNSDDAIRNGRISRGSSHYNAELTEDIVREARTRVKAGESVWRLAEEFSVSKNALYIAVTRRGWKHVT